MKKRYYIAYGSNLNIEQMSHRCPTARIVGTSEVPDYELLFKGSKTGSYLTIEPKKGSKVPVAVWEVTPADERSLDRYEGFPTSYYKKSMVLPVKRIDGRTTKTEVFVYIMHEDRNLGLPHWFYVKICKEGYEAFGFDTKYINDAIRKSDPSREEGTK